MAPGFSDIILLLGAAQGFFLVALLIHKAGRLFANRFLAALLLFYSLILLHLFFTETGFYREHPALLIIAASFPWLIGPLHYLYARALVRPQQRLSRKDGGHFLPFLLFLGYAFARFWLRPEMYLAEQPNFEIMDIPFSYLLTNWLMAVQGLTYMFLTMALLKRYAAAIRQVFSTVEKVKLDWLRTLTLIALLCWLLFFLENSLLSAGINLSGFDLSSTLLAVAVYAMGYLGFLKSEIFLQPAVAASIGNLPEIAEIEEDSPGKKYEKSGLSPEQAKQYEAKLLALMESEKPYINSELTLPQLAALLEMSPHNLSEVLNTRLRQNFFDFVNGYRVEAVKKDLADLRKQHLTILAIALDAGFNSKTAFNTIFKKFTGLTPSEFRKRV